MEPYEGFDEETGLFYVLSEDNGKLKIVFEEEDGEVVFEVFISPIYFEGIMDFLLDMMVRPNGTGYVRR